MQYLRILLSRFEEEDFQWSRKQKPNFCIFSFSKFCQNACRWSFTNILTTYNGLGLGIFLVKYETPSAVCFREKVEYVKIWFLSYNFMINADGTTNT